MDITFTVSGDMRKVWDDLLISEGDNKSESKLLSEAIKLRALLALQKKAGEDFYADVNLNNNLVAVGEFLNIY